MPFPTHPLRQFPDQSNKAVEHLQPKLIGFTPMAFCDFFENFNVIQTYSETHKEYIQGIYSNNNLIGHVYLGTKYTGTEIAAIVEKIMPKHYNDDLTAYHQNNPHITYYKYDHSRYAFVFENVLQPLDR